MDLLLPRLATGFPPSWFGDMKFAGDWVAVVSLLVALYVAWKTLGPMRKTKLKLILGLGVAGPFGEMGFYRGLVVVNRGNYPANGVTLSEKSIVEPIHSSFPLQLGDIPPWQGVTAPIGLIGYERAKFYITYRDADNKLIRRWIRVDSKYVWTEISPNYPPASVPEKAKDLFVWLMRPGRRPKKKEREQNKED